MAAKKSARKVSDGMEYLGELPGVPVRDFVHLHIRVNEDHCKAPKWVKRLDDRWAKVSTHSIVTHVAPHFLDTPINPQVDDPKRARLQQAWGGLCHFNPRGEKGERGKRLVITPGQNSDARSYANQLLGVGVSLVIICEYLGVPLSTVTRVNFNPKVFHDFEGLRGNKRVLLEARGRYRGGARKKAIEQVEEKFKAHRNFSQAVGALVYTDSRATRDRCDVELIDPPGVSDEDSAYALERAIAGHYAEYLTDQNLPGGHILSMLSRVPSQQFASFHRNTFAAIWKDLLIRERSRPTRLGRTSMTIEGVKYLGSMWEGWAAPAWVKAYVQDADQGTLFMGLPLKLFDLFSNLDTIPPLQFMDTGAATRKDDLVYLRRADGFVVVWAREPGLLMNHS